MLLSAPALAVDYETELKGADAPEVKSQIEAAIPLLSGDKPDFATYGALRREAETALKEIERIGRSEGYYNTKANYTLDLDEEPPRLTFRVRQGRKFKIKAYQIFYDNDIDDKRPEKLRDAELSPQGSPRGADLERLRQGLLAYLRAHGYPSARLTGHRVEADLDEGIATAIIQVDSGPRARFGQIEWSGLEKTESEYLDGFVLWEPGEIFDIEQVNALRDSFIQTGLFTTISVEPGKVGEDGRVPIRVQVAERERRTIGVGVSYSTNVGPGGEAFWENRNIGGRAETLKVETEVTQINQRARVSFRKPQPGNRGAWFTSFEAENEDTDAFSGQTGTARFGYERRLNQRWRISTAVEAEGSNIQDTFGERTNLLLGFPQRADFSTINDPLNPTRGSKVTFQVTPTGGQSDGKVFFTTIEAKGTTHIPFDKEERYILAMWSRTAGMVAPPTEEVPANRRFFAGGAGSVRGIGYQLLGPLKTEGVDEPEPIGGRSVLEGGIEMRVRVLDSIGVVAFVEGGGVFDSAIPEPDSDMQAGAGGGVRYYTPIGPLRVDVAVPLGRRQGIDDPFQFYLSLGQAF